MTCRVPAPVLSNVSVITFPVVPLAPSPAVVVVVVVPVAPPVEVVASQEVVCFPSSPPAVVMVHLHVPSEVLVPGGHACACTGEGVANTKNATSATVARLTILAARDVCKRSRCIAIRQGKHVTHVLPQALT